MRKLKRALPVLAGVVVLMGVLTAYNHYELIAQRKAVHAKLQENVLALAVSKENKAIDTADLETMAEDGSLDPLLGQEVVFSGYGYPLNEDYRKDLGSLAKMDECCPEPIMYLNVTQLDLSPLPFDSYYFLRTPDPVTVRIEIGGETPVQFPSNAPRLFKGVLQKSEEGDRPYTLADAELVDLSRSMPGFG